jgi:hypothetical protein
MPVPSFRPVSAEAGQLGLSDLEWSNKTDWIAFGGMFGVSILSMKSICWNLDRPGQFDHDLINTAHAIHADTIPNKRVS